MTEIYLIRHTQAEGNLYRMLQGQWDGGVTALGQKQIDLLAERFRSIPVDAVYSSDLYRARQTASAVTLAHPELTIQCTPMLREINIGVWETRFFGDVQWEEPEKMDQFLHSPGQWHTDGAETYHDVQKRACAELLRIAEMHDGQSVAVFSHGVTIRCILAKILGISLDCGDELPFVGNTGITKLSFSDGRFSVEYVSDQEHLAPLSLRPWGHSCNVRTVPFDPVADRDYYKACYADAWMTAHGSLKGFSPEPYFKCAAEHCACDGEAVLRAYEGSTPLGLLDMDTERGAHAGYGWVSLLYVEPEYRGKGCAIQLLARALFHYEKLGRTAVRLHCAAENAAAAAFYRKYGFTVLSEEKSGKSTVLLLEKKLGGERFHG